LLTPFRLANAPSGALQEFDRGDTDFRLGVAAERVTEEDHITALPGALWRATAKLRAD